MHKLPRFEPRLLVESLLELQRRITSRPRQHVGSWLRPKHLDRLTKLVVALEMVIVEYVVAGHIESTSIPAHMWGLARWPALATLRCSRRPEQDILRREPEVVHRLA
jgi:hypothetical protein